MKHIRIVPSDGPTGFGTKVIFCDGEKETDISNVVEAVTIHLHCSEMTRVMLVCHAEVVGQFVVDDENVDIVGSEDDTETISIDARGAAPGVEHDVVRALNAKLGDAVTAEGDTPVAPSSQPPSS